MKKYCGDTPSAPLNKFQHKFSILHDYVVDSLIRKLLKIQNLCGYVGKLHCHFSIIV